jgi:hypothetical protein
MARLLLDSLELQDVAAGIWFDIVEGGLDDLPNFDGTDDDVLRASGQRPGLWIATVRPLRLFGHVWGVGADPAACRAAYRAKVDALMAKMQTPTLVTLVAHPPNEGLATGQTATLSNLRPLGSTPGPIRGWEGARAFDLQFRSIKSPPTWAVAGP